jgi:signal transduction histidine kinase
MAKFTVDTHLFRELGELLVGRDSTALVELIKNAYDADATRVTVHGEDLDDPERGRLVISDDGNGMTPRQFEDGFLCIASRVKEEGGRRSRRHGRRYTGAKGVGRLAAHKLARRMQIYSIPDLSTNAPGAEAVCAGIDWDQVEACRTLADVEASTALTLLAEPRDPLQQAGTIMELQRLRRRWTPAERSRLFWEVQNFQPAAGLINLPEGVLNQAPLFDRPRISDTAAGDPGFRVDLTGDFEVGEEFWQAVLQTAFWVIEIDAREEDRTVYFRITPTARCLADCPGATQTTYSIPHPDPTNGPFFQARILVREGSGNFGTSQRGWVGRNAGIRVYMEGFRVLPYGAADDDWLEINADFKRTRTFRHLEPFGFEDGEVEQKDAAYMFLRSDAYFGGVFLTQAGAPSLRMLVNREGFIPDAGYDTLVRLVRIATDLSVRHRVLAYRERREGRREARRERAQERHQARPTATRLALQETVRQTVQSASDLAAQARQQAAAWQFDQAQELIDQAAAQFGNAAHVAEQLITEPTTLRVIASVGLQMVSFVHEIKTVLATAGELDQTLKRLRSTGKVYPSSGTVFARLHADVNRMRQEIERQASYLTEITSPDGQRRRSRHSLRERFEAAADYVRDSARRAEIELLNDLPAELRSPPMFRSELAMVFTNLLTNAVKAAGNKGRIRASGSVDSAAALVLVRVENSGRAVDLADAEKWFRPFQSTTVDTDPLLGQGMGMGLPITRDLLEEYGASIAFTAPAEGFATALELRFPADAAEAAEAPGPAAVEPRR